MPREVEVTDEDVWTGNPGGQLDFMNDWTHWAVALAGGWGSGKALALDTWLPTPTGWTRMGAVKKGDQLFSEQGYPCTVIATTPVMLNHKCYRIEFCDGTEVVADAGHLWLTEDHACRKSANRFKDSDQLQRMRWPKVVTTDEIRDTLYANDRKDSNHSIPNTEPLVTYPRHLPIGPYTLGAWLGDGCSTQCSITVADTEVLDGIRADGYKVSIQPSSRHRTASQYVIKVAGTLYRDPRTGKIFASDRHLKNELRKMSLIGKREKYIPEKYLRASIRQRLELLQGLMDTDGTVSPSGNCEFTSILRPLAEGVAELVISLGMKANVTEGRAKLNGKDCGPKYRVHFSPNMPVFTIRRKLDRQFAKSKRRSTTGRRYIRNVVPVPSVPVRCVSVDSPNHLFLCSKSMIPTHNSYIGSRKLLTLHVHNAFTKDGKATYIWSAIIAPSYPNARDFCVPALVDAAGEIGLECEYKAAASEFIFPDLGTQNSPSKIIVRTADKPERISGWQVGAAWGDEVARWKVNRHDPLGDPFLQLTGRVRHNHARFCQLMCTFTHEGDGTRVYEEFSKGHKTHKMYTASTKENPSMQKFYELQSELLSPELREQYLEGKALNLRGRMLYSQFAAADHVTDGLTIDDTLPIQMSLDFNIAPGMHCLIGQYNPITDMFTTVHEIHERRLDVRGVIPLFVDWIDKNLGGWNNRGQLEVYGDATGASKWAGTGESCYQVLAEGLDAAQIPFRIRVPKSNPFIIDRVNSVNSTLKDVRGKIHWRINSQCERLLADLQQMRYDDHGEPDKHEMSLSHASEAEGYRIHYLRPIRRFDDKPTGRMSVVVN